MLPHTSEPFSRLVCVFLSFGIRPIGACLHQNCIFVWLQKKPYSNHFADFDPKYFWQWTDFQSYVECILCLAVVGGVLMFFLKDFSPFVQTLGFAAVFTEAMLGAPQFYRNLKNKSTFGMR